MGNVGVMSLNTVHWSLLRSLLDSFCTVYKHIIKMNTAEAEISPFPFQHLEPAAPTVQLSDITFYNYSFGVDSD